MCDDKRRDFLRISGQTALLAATAPLLNMGYISAAQAAQADSHILVYVFLRGGWDGLSVMVPTNNARGLADLRKLRPVGGKIAMDQKTLLKLKDGETDFGFGLHPALKGVHGLWKNGQVLLIHGAGGMSENRSHFEQMALIETGVAAKGINVAGSTGFMNRALMGLSPSANIQGVAVSSLIPTSLKGGKPTLASTNFQNYFRQIDASKQLRDISSKDQKRSRAALEERLRSHLIGNAPAEPGSADRQLSGAGRNGLRSLDLVEDIIDAAPAGDYGTGGAGQLLSQAARVVKAQRGKPADQAVRTITVDIGGWDSHFNQQDMLMGSLSGLDAALTAFAKDVLPLGNVTIVVQSEFGRTAHENGTGGTDHGRGTVMMVLAPKGQLAKRVLVDDGAEKFSLKEAQLSDKRDLRVIFDYREIFAEVLTKRMGMPKALLHNPLTVGGKEIAAIFPKPHTGFKMHNIFKGKA